MPSVAAGMALYEVYRQRWLNKLHLDKFINNTLQKNQDRVQTKVEL